MWRSIEKGPYKRPMIPNSDNTEEEILEPLSKMTEGNKKQYIADVKVMNYLLQAIHNDIYNSVDACKNAKDMWERITRLMFGSDVTSHVRPSRLMDEFDKFATKEGESLESMYERLTTLGNIMDRNNVRPIPMSINTNFLNCLQPEWNKYVTMKPRVRDAKYFREQMLLAIKDEAGSNLKYKENYFMLDNSYRDETLEELTVAVIMMARIQPADDNGVQKPDYDAKAVSEFYKTDVISMSDSLSENLKELQQELIEETELKKSSNDSKDIQANLLKRIKILENDFKRSQAQSIDFELQLQHQKEKMACDVSWKSRLSKLNDENVLLKTQVNFVVQERENIKLEYQTLFNSIKATRAQHQQDVKELVENISPKTYAYGDVRSKNQDLLMVISELKEKLKSFEKRKDVNTKFDKSVTSGKTLYVTPLSHNIAVKAKKVSNLEDNTDRLKPVTSYSIPKSEQKQKKNANVPTRGMYKIQKQELHARDYKTNMNVSNSTRVGSSNSVRRPKSKDTKSKN
ncbi:hypothetical protein Tco_0787556, partial [Tanacetum coccineum]